MFEGEGAYQGLTLILTGDIYVMRGAIVPAGSVLPMPDPIVTQ